MCLQQDSELFIADARSSDRLLAFPTRPSPAHAVALAFTAQQEGKRLYSSLDHLHRHGRGEVINSDTFIYRNYEFALSLSTRWIGLATLSEGFTQPMHSLFLQESWIFRRNTFSPGSGYTPSVSQHPPEDLGAWDLSQRPLVTMQSTDPGLLPSSVWMMGTATRVMNLAVGTGESQGLRRDSD